MTNEEIIQSVRSKYVAEGQVTMYTTEQIGFMLNMLREEFTEKKMITVRDIAARAWQDAANAYRMYPNNKHTFTNYWTSSIESYRKFLEQPEGVEVWVSWDGNNSMVAPEIWIMRPRPNMNGTFTGKVHHDAISSKLNLSPGECAKFKIVRVE